MLTEKRRAQPRAVSITFFSKKSLQRNNFSVLPASTIKISSPELVVESVASKRSVSDLQITGRALPQSKESNRGGPGKGSDLRKFNSLLRLSVKLDKYSDNAAHSRCQHPNCPNIVALGTWRARSTGIVARGATPTELLLRGRPL